nr:MAG: major capsid protein [Microviridae sp.]
MAIKKTLGGDRLGSEGKMTVTLDGYERSTHDLTYPFRTAMPSGVVVPFMKQVALTNDEWDIELQMDVRTLPTLAPLIGSYKCEADIFLADIRLYQGELHNNATGIGNNMQNVHLPYNKITAQPYDDTIGLVDQINKSSIYHFLGVKGIGQVIGSDPETRKVNGIPFLAFWDIWKNYFSNKQEENGFVIHNRGEQTYTSVEQFEDGVGTWVTPLYPSSAPGGPIDLVDRIVITLPVEVTEQHILDVELMTLTIANPAMTSQSATPKIGDIYGSIVQTGLYEITASIRRGETWPTWLIYNYRPAFIAGTQISEFPLTNIDEMRWAILRAAGDYTAFDIQATGLTPYILPNETIAAPNGTYAYQQKLEGLPLKTYMSDLLNNWVDKTTYDNITNTTSLSVDAPISIDAIRLAEKTNKLLQRILVAGGTYNDWLEAVWGKEKIGLPEIPVYIGSLIKELVFTTVLSTAAVQNAEQGMQPIGTLAGMGQLNHTHKGGRMTVRVNEPAYIMGVVHITPRPDYSQGNDFDIDLQTMNDFHMPALDEIGFQELPTERMAWFGSTISGGIVTKYSAGYQPAWIDYMTNIPQVHGELAEPNGLMYWTLNRRYEQDPFNTSTGIIDVTTYVDPAKFNYIFAETDEAAQNFIMQVGINATVRRTMSGKIMPNL